jgi:hypothetical protein
VQLELAVDGAGGQEDVDARAGGVAQRLPGAVDVGGVAPGQPADDRAAHLPRDRLHRLEVPRRGDRETCLDDVHAELLQGEGDLELLGEVHACPGGLFAVAQGRVEDDQAVLWHGRTP